jgi:hypothetical protein
MDRWMPTPPKATIARTLRDLGELFPSDERSREFMDGLVKAWGLDEEDPAEDDEDGPPPAPPRGP